jgi:ketosteroid isomerase-like protein
MRAAGDNGHARVVRDFLEARARGNYDAAVALLTPDAVWHSPVEGPRKGRSMIREMLAAAERDTDNFSSRLENVEARGARAVATIVNQGERKGEELDSRQWLVFQFDGEAISDIAINVDDPTAVERFWDA